MKFYGNGIVWDAERNRILCEFVNGEYTTNDEREIEILKAGEFESQIEIEEIIEVEPEKKPKKTRGQKLN
jgi:hypothetical protein